MTDVKAILEERGHTHGVFADTAQIKIDLLDIIMAARAGAVTLAYMEEALSHICTKLSRIANGDAQHVDNWLDIAGYATLVALELEKKGAL